MEDICKKINSYSLQNDVHYAIVDFHVKFNTTLSIHFVLQVILAVLKIYPQEKTPAIVRIIDM